MKKLFFVVGVLGALMSTGCSQGPVEVKERVLVKEDEGITLDIKIPEIEDQKEFNQQALKLGEDLEARVREFQEMYLAENPSANNSILSKGQISEGKMDFEIKFVDEQTVSVLNEISIYAAGGARGGRGKEPLNYDLGTGSAIELADLFDGDNYLVELSELARLELGTRDFKEWVDDPSMEIDEDQQYYLTPEHVVLVYDQNEIAAGAAGPLEILIEKSDLESLKEIYR